MSVRLITGTSTGIGLATTLHLAHKGHQLYVSLRNPDAATELKQAISNEKLPVTRHAQEDVWLSY
jgi:NAD(P)-dependent dehydrogenase (short-subunit alcohol dehydrogenase family)